MIKIKLYITYISLISFFSCSISNEKQVSHIIDLIGGNETFSENLEINGKKYSKKEGEDFLNSLHYIPDTIYIVNDSLRHLVSKSADKDSILLFRIHYTNNKIKEIRYTKTKSIRNFYVDEEYPASPCM